MAPAPAAPPSCCKTTGEFRLDAGAWFFICLPRQSFVMCRAFLDHRAATAMFGLSRAEPRPLDQEEEDSE